MFRPPPQSRLVCALALLLVVVPHAAAATGSSATAALQVGLRAKGFYAGTVDGVVGPETTDAVRALQRRAGLIEDGVVGARTRAALGKRGRPSLGRRLLSAGVVGWDVAQLQFLLAWHGFPTGTLDGVFGPHTNAALLKFQRWAGIVEDARAGPETIAALRRPLQESPLRLLAPVAVPTGDGFGPRGARFHAGLDFAAQAGTPVVAAADGRVAYAAWLRGGWGLLVAVAHADGVRTLYAHLSRTRVEVGQLVTAGDEIGLVGATGRASGPHLHFELRLRGAAIDPLPALF
jgi:murein DD-endopeptidase MepM/ murein hydrolase activator NlpD